MVGEKERRALGGIVDHMNIVASCVHQLAVAYEAYTTRALDTFKAEAVKMRGLEKDADEARRQVELAIYSGAFVPIHREDYLNLAETIDKVADDSVSVVNMLELTGVEIPSDVLDTVKNMISETTTCVDTLRECVSVSLQNREKGGEVARRVEELEEVIDDMEFQLRYALYRMKIDGYDKILLNDLVEKIGDISDSAEDASDLLVVMISKRL